MGHSLISCNPEFPQTFCFCLIISRCPKSKWSKNLQEFFFFFCLKEKKNQEVVISKSRVEVACQIHKESKYKLCQQLIKKGFRGVTEHPGTNDLYNCKQNVQWGCKRIWKSLSVEYCWHLVDIREQCRYIITNQQFKIKG